MSRMTTFAWDGANSCNLRELANVSHRQKVVLWSFWLLRFTNIPLPDQFFAGAALSHMPPLESRGRPNGLWRALLKVGHSFSDIL